MFHILTASFCFIISFMSESRFFFMETFSSASRSSDLSYSLANCEVRIFFRLHVCFGGYFCTIPGSTSNNLRSNYSCLWKYSCSHCSRNVYIGTSKTIKNIIFISGHLLRRSYIHCLWIDSFNCVDSYYFHSKNEEINDSQKNMSRPMGCC